MQESSQYINLITSVILKGTERPTRNANVISIFSPQRLEYDISEEFPLVTSKFVNFNNIVNELLWFLKGQTNGEILKINGTNIWGENGKRDFLDNVGLTKNEVDDLGAIYGFQWRHFGADYLNCKTDYTSKGFDQLEDIVKKLIFDPNSRRIILTAWNPKDLPKMALPPCHLLAQFYVSTNLTLNCHMYQRSADVGLGVPYNIASYSLLTSILAHFTGLKTGKLYYTIGDAHIYESHIDNLKIQSKRRIYKPPSLLILKPKANRSELQFNPFAVQEIVKEIESLTPEDFLLQNYYHGEKIKLMFY